MKNKIEKVIGYEMLDSRGNPTVGARVILQNSVEGFALSPSGASTGQYEAHELRDGGERYGGRGVLTAVENINGEIEKELYGLDVTNQHNIDKRLVMLDSTENKSRLGANALLAVSLACARAAANSIGIPLYKYLGGVAAIRTPIPMMNVLNGGAHANNNIDIQEFMIMPLGSKSFAEALKMGTETYHTLGKILKRRGLASGIGDEGGFAPTLNCDTDALDLLVEAINESGYTTNDIGIALDIASSEWYRDGVYHLPKRDENFTTDEMIDYIESLTNKYPIISVEDGLGDTDYKGWQKLTARLGNKVQLVGDDLFVTNTSRLQDGINGNYANAILIKPNQIGTLSQTLEVVDVAKQNYYNTIISHRSGETEDTFISDLSVAVNSGQIKTGAPARTDRVAKYNRLSLIENELIN